MSFRSVTATSTLNSRPPITMVAATTSRFSGLAAADDRVRTRRKVRVQRCSGSARVDPRHDADVALAPADDDFLDHADRARSRSVARRETTVCTCPSPFDPVDILPPIIALTA